MRGAAQAALHMHLLGVRRIFVTERVDEQGELSCEQQDDKQRAAWR